VTSSLRDLKVYTTYPHRCSYLEGEEATTLFIDPRQSVDQTLYSNLSMLGFPPQRQPYLPAALQSLQRLYPGARPGRRLHAQPRPATLPSSRNADLEVDR
jgi:arginyl-tRNA--protein-N-Asp/Glu arginylyltransferase